MTGTRVERRPAPLLRSRTRLLGFVDTHFAQQS
jgi:hypothetical protein